MPFSPVHGKNAFLAASLPSGASTLLHGDANSMVLAISRDNPMTTTFGDQFNQRIAGIGDATLTGAGVWNTDIDASSLALTLDTLIATSAITPLAFAPGGSVAGSPLYNACMLLNSYDITAAINGPVAFTFSFQNASGSVISGCCAA